MEHDPTHATTRLIGRYQILEKLESGGMGIVYRALDPRLQTQVCIKQIKEGPGSDQFRKRWLPEVRAIAQLRHHPNIVTIYDASEVEFGGVPTIVMEFIEGKTLQRTIRDGDPITLATRLHYIEQLAAGLAHAHSKNIVHRDIKPANLMVDRAGMLKILDFGIARMSAGTTASAIIGTMNYMSPEQWGREPIDARCDMFSAGAVFYELLTGRRAFPGDTPAEIYPMILNGRPIPVEELSPDIDREIVRIVNRMLEKRPADRFASMSDVQREVERARARLTPVAEESFTATLRPSDFGREAATPTPAAALGARATIDRQAVVRRRLAKIDSSLQAARFAIDRADYEAAHAACEQVLELDPEHAVALDLLERSREGLQQREVQHLLDEARQRFAQADFARAAPLVSRALALEPESPEVRALQDQILRAQVDAERSRSRSAALQHAMSRVHAAIDSGQLEEALECIDTVLSIDPMHGEALRLRTLVHRLVEERDRRRETTRPASIGADTVVRSFDQFRANHPTEVFSDTKVAPRSDGPAHLPGAAARSWRPAVGAAVAVLLIVSAGAFVMFRSRTPNPPVTVDTPAAPAAAGSAALPSTTVPPADANPSVTLSSAPAPNSGTSLTGTHSGSSAQPLDGPKPPPSNRNGGRGVASRPPVGQPAVRASGAAPAPVAPPPAAPGPPATASTAGPAAAPTNADPEAEVAARLTANRYLRRARDFLSAGDSDNATVNAEAARKLDPSNPGLAKLMEDIERFKNLERRRRGGGQPSR